MPAGLTKRDIQVGIDQAWHGDTVIQPKIDKGNCGIIYPFELRRLVIPDGNGGEVMREVPILDKNGQETGQTEIVPACDFYQVMTLDDNLPVGNPVQKGYKVIPNEQMIDTIVSSLEGTSHQIVSVGTVQDRSKAFCSVKLSDNIMAGNRETQNVLNFLWGHGGVFAVHTLSGFTVVVCQNTFNAALYDVKNKKREFRAKIKHTGKADIKIENMGKAVELHYGVVGEFKKAMDSLSTQSCDTNLARQIFAGFLVRDEEPEEISTRTSNTIDTLESLFKTGKGNNGRDMADTFNALTDYYSHKSSGGEDNWRQYVSSEFGSGAVHKREAYDLLTGKKVPKLGDYAEVVKRGERVLQLI